MTCSLCGHEPAVCTCGEVVTGERALREALREVLRACDDAGLVDDFNRLQYIANVARAALAQEGR